MTKRFISFYETKQFIRDANKTIGEDEHTKLKQFLAFDPEAGVIIPGTGGVRKLRWVRPGIGKRGGARVIYYFYRDDVPLFLFAIYAKNVKDDLTQSELKELKKRAEEIKSAYKGGNKND